VRNLIGEEKEESILNGCASGKLIRARSLMAHRSEMRKGPYLLPARGTRPEVKYMRAYIEVIESASSQMRKVKKR